METISFSKDHMIDGLVIFLFSGNVSWGIIIS